MAFDDRLIDYTRTTVSPHLVTDDHNIALVFSNGSLSDGHYVLVSHGPVPAAVLSWRTFGAAYMAPLWLHSPLGGPDPTSPKTCSATCSGLASAQPGPG